MAVRVHKVIRLAVSLIIFVAFVLLVINSRDDGKVRISKEAALSAFWSKNELHRKAQTEKCPLCFGQDFCKELQRDDLRISSREFDAEGLLPGVHQAFRDGDIVYWLRPLTSFEVNLRGTEAFERFVCRNATNTIKYRELATKTGDDCDRSLAAKVGFLRTIDFDALAMRNLYRAHLVSRKRLPMTVCPSWKTIQGFVKAFDMAEDNALTAEEKAQMITAIAGWPDVAVNRFLRSQNVRVPFPHFYGSCGTFSVFEPAQKPLAAFLNEPADVRKGLGAQLLRLVDTLINDDSNWMLLTTQITIDNVVITNGGDAALLDLSQMLIIDRDLLDHDANDIEDSSLKRVCTYDCLEKRYERLIVADDTAECFKVDSLAQIMYALVCRNVLSDMELERETRPMANHGGKDNRGLLHSISNEDEAKEINDLLRECIDESEVGGRLKAAMHLSALLDADFGANDDEDDEDEDRDENEEIETGDDEQPV